MYSKYIDIDSTYRNRNENPIPSEFTVHLEQSGQATNGIQSLDPVSMQSVTFPPQSPIGQTQLQLEPLAFYTETLQSPYNTIVERDYLPYMYSLSTTTTIIQLDELPIASTVSTTTEIMPTTEFPRLTIVPGETDNYYTGDYLENMSTGEIKQIVGYAWVNSSTPLQAGVMVAYSLLGTNIYIELDPHPNNGPPPSNVDRFYQGKTIQFSDGTTRLIINSFMNSLGNPIIQILTPLTSVPAMGTSVLIIAPEAWYATIDTPFSVVPSSYPAYRSPLPTGSTIYSKIGLTTDVKILSIDSIRHVNNTIGVVYQTYRQLVYVTSTDSTGSAWNAPVIIKTLGVTASDFTFVTAISCSISLAIINGNPAILYTEGFTNEVHLMYIQSDSSSGLTWNNASSEIGLGGTASEVIANNTFSNIRMQPAPAIQDGVTGFFADTIDHTGYPEIAYSNGTNGCVTVRLSSGSYSSPTWTTRFEGSSPTVGYVIDFGLYLNCTSAQFVTTSPNLRDRELLTFKSAATGLLTLYQATTAGSNWISPAVTYSVVMGTESGNIVAVPTLVSLVTNFVTVTQFVNLPTCVWADATNTIYSRGMGLDASNFSSGSYTVSGRTAGEPTIQITTSTTSPVVFGVLNAPSVTYATGVGEMAIYYINGTTLEYALQDVISYAIEPPSVIDDAFQLELFTILENSTYTNALAFYQTSNDTLYGAIPTTESPVLGVQYRIRNGIPLSSGIGGTATGLLSGTTITAKLPVSLSPSALIGSFIWIYNQNVYTIPTPYQTFNDYRLIIAYDESTQTITVGTPFSGDIDTLAIPGGTNTVNWEILSFDHDNFSPLMFIGPNVSFQEMICYEMSLISLSLPNIILSTDIGNTIAYYPYVYVKFVNITAQNRHVIFSNNPNATTVLFKVPISNLVTPTASTFVFLNGGGMVQTVKFRPNDNFSFAVYLPNGELFETLESDTTSPFPPNPNVQVNATFGLRKVNPK